VWTGSRLSAFPDLKIEWRVESLFLITVAGPCRTYTGFPFMPLQAPRKLLWQVIPWSGLDVNGIKTFFSPVRRTLPLGMNAFSVTAEQT
jgi:hypothetical protein